MMAPKANPKFSEVYLQMPITVITTDLTRLLYNVFAFILDLSKREYLSLRPSNVCILTETHFSSQSESGIIETSCLAMHFPARTLPFQFKSSKIRIPQKEVKACKMKFHSRRRSQVKSKWTHWKGNRGLLLRNTFGNITHSCWMQYKLQVQFIPVESFQSSWRRKSQTKWNLRIMRVGSRWREDSTIGQGKHIQLLRRTMASY